MRQGKAEPVSPVYPKSCLHYLRQISNMLKSVESLVHDVKMKVENQVRAKCDVDEQTTNAISKVGTVSMC